MGEVAKPERDKPTHRNDRQNAGIHQFDLLVCWLFLIAIHAFIFPWVIRLCFLWDSPIPAWGITGAVGSFAVCLALSTRPLATRLMMGAITLFSVRASTGYVLSHLFNSQHSLARRSYLPPLRMNQFLLNFMDDTAAQSAAILIGWLFGALVAGYCFTWFTGFRISPPGTPTNRKVLSIRNLFIATCVAAAVSQFIDKQFFHKQLLHMSTGVSAGLIATSVAFAVFYEDWRRRWVPIAITLPGVVILDIAVGTLVGAWSGALAIRAFHNVAFVVCASVSPLVTFLVLRVYGYYSPHTSG